MTLMIGRPPASTRPWWHLRPSERRPLAWIVGVGGPTGFALGALLGIFLQVPGPPLAVRDPAAGRPVPTSTQVAPPGPRSVPSPARPRATGSDAATRRAARADVTRPATSSTTRRARPPAPTRTTTRTTVTVTSTPPTTPPSTPPTTDREGSAPEGGDSLGADPS